MGKTCPHCGAPHGNNPAEAAINEIGFGPVTRAMLLKLARRPGTFHETAELIAAAYASDPNGGPEDGGNSVKVLLCNARKRLAAHGIAIIGRRGRSNGAYKLEFIVEAAANKIDLPPAGGTSLEANLRPPVLLHFADEELEAA